MSENYEILGIPVDKKTHDKYAAKAYDIGGEKDVSLSGVKLWATSEELGLNYPNIQAGAKKIMDQIRAEITGKEEKPMNTPKTGKDFLDALMGIYTESRTAYANLWDAQEKARKFLEDCQEKERKAKNADLSFAQALTSKAQAEYNLAKENHRAEYARITQDYDAKVRELREQFASELEASYSANPDKLDGATMQLLTSGVCTATDLQRLSDRHGNNPTMLRIIGGYAERLRKGNGLSDGDQMKCAAVMHKAKTVKDGSRELAVFDSAASSAAYGLDKNPSHAARMDANHVGGFFEGCHRNMEAITNRPAEMV